MNENDKYIKKINIISKNEEIVNSFLKNINATLIEKKNIGVEFAFCLFREKRFQFWITSNNLDNNRSSFFNGSDTIVYFYSIDEKLDEEYLKFLKKKVKSLRKGLTILSF